MCVCGGGSVGVWISRAQANRCEGPTGETIGNDNASSKALIKDSSKPTCPLSHPVKGLPSLLN